MKDFVRKAMEKALIDVDGKLWGNTYVPDVFVEKFADYLLQTKPTITKLNDKVVAVTMTDDEHRITEVLWEAPKPLSNEEIANLWHKHQSGIGATWDGTMAFARAIEERHGIK